MYRDNNQKEIFVNRKNLVIYHKKFNKTYFYPVSKSFFTNILDKKKFETLVLKGTLSLEKDSYHIKYSEEDKGGGVLGALGTHAFDIINWLIGPTQEIIKEAKTSDFDNPISQNGE